MRRRRAFREQRRPIYIGCEGMSEHGYASVLQDMVREAGAPLHLIIDELAPGAGDPLARIEMAVRRIAHISRTRIAPVERFVMLDHDQAERDPQRAERAVRKAQDNEITIIWQRPCFEAVLLRHLDGRADRRPPDTPEAHRALEREWPGYSKPMTRADLARRIDHAAIIRAARVEPDLAALFRVIGIVA